MKHGNADGFDAIKGEDGTVELDSYIAGELDVMEQRGSNLIQAIMVGGCAMAAPVIEQIPSSVLWGYFAFMSLESIPDFQLSNRIVVLFTETSGRQQEMEGNVQLTTYVMLCVLFAIRLRFACEFGETP